MLNKKNIEKKMEVDKALTEVNNLESGVDEKKYELQKLQENYKKIERETESEIIKHDEKLKELLSKFNENDLKSNDNNTKKNAHNLLDGIN